MNTFPGLRGRTVLATLTLCGIILGLIGIRSVAAKDSPWPMFRHDPGHSGRTPFSGPGRPDVAWVFTADDGIASSPAIGADGTVYVGAGWNFWGVTDSSLYAVNPDGSLKWRFKTGHGIFSSPAVGSDGTIYFGSLDKYFYAVDDSVTYGNLKWKRLLNNWVYSSPAVGPDTTIYVGSINYRVFAFRPDGDMKWSFSTRSCVFSSPAVNREREIFIGSKDEHLYALKDTDSEAELLWSYMTGEFYDGYLVDSSPAIGSDGTIYVGTDPYGSIGHTPVPVDRVFHAVNPDGTRKWIFPMEDGAESSPAIGPDGTVYIGSYDGNLYAIRDEGEAGTLKWSFQTRGSIDGSPVVDGCGTIYVGSRDSTLYAVNPDGTLKWAFPSGGEIESSPAIDDKGRLYIGTFSGDLYALGRGGPDAGIVSVDLPREVKADSLYHPEVIVRNYRAGALNFSVSCRIEAGREYMYGDTLFVTELQETTSVQLTFAPWLTSPQIGESYSITVEVILPDDDNPYNNEVTVKSLAVVDADFTRGDLNRDGAVNVLDIVRTVRIILERGEPPSTLEQWLADCDGDGIVTVMDVMGIVNAVLRLSGCDG